jgi:Glycosyltransferase family 87
VLACTAVTAHAAPFPTRSTILTPGRVRAIRHGLSAAGLLVAAYLLVFVAPLVGTFGYDAYAYWAADPSAYGTIPIGALGFFGYAPPLAQLAQVFHLVPWWVFDFAVTCVLFGTLFWMARRWTLAWLAFPPVLIELYHGNIHLLLAAAIVLGFRYPWTWSFVLLSKVTPGVGLLWFAVRREWRALGIALGVTAVIASISFLADPAAWSAWFGVLGQGAPADCGMHCIPIPLVARLPLAVAIVVAGALTGRRWTVPLAAMLALPVLWIAGLSMLVGVQAVWRMDAQPGAVSESRRARSWFSRLPLLPTRSSG